MMNDQIFVEILLVEDNMHDAELTIRALKKFNFANNLVHMKDGAEALDFLFGRGIYEERNVGQCPRVMLLDLKLPKVSGLEVLRAVKSDPVLCKLPVVIVTSSTEDPDIRTAYELGANSYVVKPVEFDSFMNAMSQLGMYWVLVNQPLK
jgi:two-component system, response regulator